MKIEGGKFSGIQNIIAAIYPVFGLRAILDGYPLLYR